MKPDRIPLTIVLGAVLIGGAILWNGHLDRVAQNPSLDIPSRSEVREAIVRSCPLYQAPPKNVYGPPSTGKEVTSVDVKEVKPSLDGTRLRVGLTYSTSDNKVWKTDIVLIRDDFGKYTGSWQHGDTKSYLVLRD